MTFNPNDKSLTSGPVFDLASQNANTGERSARVNANLDVRGTLTADGQSVGVQLASSVVNGDTTHAPSGDAVFDGLAAVQSAAASDATTKANAAAAASIPSVAPGADGNVLTSDGAGNWGSEAPSGGGGANTVTTPILLSSTTVDLNEGTGAKQPLYTCPASRRCMITNIVIQKLSANLTAASATIGWNANADNIVEDLLTGNVSGLPTTKALVAGIPDANDAINFLTNIPVIGTAADVLGLIVTTPEGSALTAKVDVYGYLTDTNGVPIANVNGTGDGAAISPASISVNGGPAITSLPVTKAQRVSTGSIGGGLSALVTLTWTVPFADANYTVSVSVQDSTAALLSLMIVHIESVSASAITVRVSNTTVATPITGTLHAIAIHD